VYTVFTANIIITFMYTSIIIIIPVFVHATSATRVASTVKVHSARRAEWALVDQKLHV